MTFEDELSDRLHTNARDLDVTGRGVDHVVGRARTRQRHRRAVVGGVGAFALLAGAAGYAGLRDDDPAGVAVGTLTGLPSSGPLELDWSVAEGGVTWGLSDTVAPDGTIYALSTAPGTRLEDREARPPTLYELGDDGTWTVRNPASTGVDLADVAAGPSLLYGVSTAPVTGGEGYAPVLSTSSDGGAGWDRTELPAVEAPSDVVDWSAASELHVAATRDVAVAVVSTTFSPAPDEISALAGVPDEAQGWQYSDGGLAVGQVEAAADGRAQDPSGATPDTQALTRLPDLGEGVAAATTIPPSTVVPWSRLGVEGADDLRRTDVYVDQGAGWERVDAGAAAGQYVVAMTTIGDEIVLTGIRGGPEGPDGGPVVLATTDGRTWRSVATPSGGAPVVGLGDAWVTVDGSYRALQVSTDRGATWRSVPFPSEVPSDWVGVGSLASGALGLAFPVTDGQGGGDQKVLVTRDLEHWEVLDLADLGITSDLGSASVIVGTDRIVVTVAVPGDGDPGDPSRSRTIIGTPVRTPSTTEAPTTLAAPTTTITSSPSSSGSSPASTVGSSGSLPSGLASTTTTSSPSSTAPVGPSTTTTTTGPS